MSRHSLKEIERIKRIAASADFGKPISQGSLAVPAGSAKYRLVCSQDAICIGDERLCDDCETWEVITNEFVGTRYNGNFFVPMRRKVFHNNDSRQTIVNETRRT